MKEKMKSAIIKIDVNDATFEHEIIEPTYINFFYGKNGVGKSTIAKTIKSNEGLQWKNGVSASNYDVLVYDIDFINDNFSNYNNLPGIFTIGKENVEMQEKLNPLQVQIKQKRAEYVNLKQNVDAKKTEKEEALASFQKDCWSRTNKLRKDFASALKGSKTKATFADKILATYPIRKNYDELLNTYNILYNGDDKLYSTYSMPNKITYISLPGFDLMGKSVVSSSDTSFSNFIKALNATDWVRQGHQHYAEKAGGKCPYCQQALPTNIEKDIANCFDEQYQADVANITKFQMVYKTEMNSVLRILEQNLNEKKPDLNIENYQAKLKNLEDAVTINIQRIDAKVKEPSMIVFLEDTVSITQDLRSIISALNFQINTRNRMINDIENQKEEYISDVWKYLAFFLKDEVKKYRDDVVSIDKEISNLESRMMSITKEGQKLSAQISELNKKVVSIDAVIEGINRILLTSGFQGFRLSVKNDVANAYEVIRSDGSVVEKLSDGERKFIAFLYFYHLVKGSYNKNEAKEKIVVIDDPVSGMDNNSLSIVSALVRELIEICSNNTKYLERKVEGDFIKQIFVLTHNVYFYKEVTYKQENSYQNVSFYLISKANNVSTVNLCVKESKRMPSEMENYNPVQNSYAALWDEYKELKTVNTLFNVMRQILEYYFIQLCSYEEDDLQRIVLENNKEKFIEAQEDENPDYSKLNLASSLLSYVNNSPALISDGINYVDDRIDAEQCRAVFKTIFEAMGQERHYKAMMNVESN